MKYKKLTKTEQNKKIAYYFEKTLNTEADLEAMLMYARNLVEVLTTKLFTINMDYEPFHKDEKKYYDKAGKQRTKIEKNAFSSYKKINVLDEKEKIPQSVVICLKALAAAGNVSVHGAEILDSSLNRPFRDLFIYLCAWYYEEIEKKSVPKILNLSSEKISEDLTDEYSYIKESDGDEQIVLYNGMGSVKHKTWSLSVQATYNQASAVQTRYKSCTFDAGKKIVKHEKSIMDNGDIIELESDEKKLVIHFTHVTNTVYQLYSGRKEGIVQIFYTIYKKEIIKREEVSKK